MSTIVFSTISPEEMKEILTSLRRLIIKSLEDNLLVEANAVESLYDIADDASAIIRCFDSKDTDDPKTILSSVNEIIDELKNIEFYAANKGYTIELDCPYITNLISQFMHSGDEYSIEPCHYYPALMYNPYTQEPFVAIYRTIDYDEVEVYDILDMYTAGVDYDFIKPYRENGDFLQGYSTVEIIDFYKHVANCHTLIRNQPIPLKHTMSIFSYDTKEEALKKAQELLYGKVRKLMSEATRGNDNTSKPEPEDTPRSTYLSPTM